MSWRERLERRMLDLGITRTELARRAGLNRTAVRDIIERGATPSIENFKNLATALNMTVAELYIKNNIHGLGYFLLFY